MAKCAGVENFGCLDGLGCKRESRDGGVCWGREFRVPSLSMGQTV
jgi:hypothetical protein